MNKIKVIITGATGMVGEGVLLECLRNEKVSHVLMVNRKPYAFSHQKLKELIVPDFLKAEDFAEQLKGYDACFYCAGVSSNGMDEATYTKITYDTTVHFAEVLKAQNPELIFNFVSGSHTDGTEKGKVMWARVKGKAENALIKMFPEKSYNYRPGLMKPVPGQKNFRGYNRYMPKLYPLLKLFFTGCSIADIGKAMIHNTIQGYHIKVLEAGDILDASKKEAVLKIEK